VNCGPSIADHHWEPLDPDHLIGAILATDDGQRIAIPAAETPPPTLHCTRCETLAVSSRTTATCQHTAPSATKSMTRPRVVCCSFGSSARPRAGLRRAFGGQRARSHQNGCVTP
jgi:hypothetical protein